MKRLIQFSLAVVALLFTGPMVSHAASRIVATLTVTNNTETGDTLTSGASIRTWTNTTTSSTIATNAAGDVNSAATNLFSHLAASSLPGPLVVQWSATNALKLIGQLDQSFSLVVTGEWAEVTYTTQSFTRSFTAIWPFDAIPAQTNRTNQASDFAYGLSTYSTQAIAAASDLASNLVNRSTDQVVAGMKSWSGTNRFYGPVFATNLTLNNVTVTNGFSPLGLGYGSTLIGSGGSAGGIGSIAIGNTVSGAGGMSVSIGYGTATAETNTVSIGAGAEANGAEGTTIGRNSSVNGLGDIAIGYLATARGTNTIVIGNQVDSTATNAVVIGRSDQEVIFSGQVTAPIVTNALLRGTNRLEAVAFQSQTIATLANGANSISLLETNASLIRFTGTISANSSLNGVAGGWAGRVAVCENASGYAITLANQSGLEGTPANRLVTGSGSDVTVPNGSYWTMIYDGASSRWDVVWVYPGAAIGIGAMVVYDVTNRVVTPGALTWATITNWTSSKAATNVTVSTAAGTLTVGQTGWYSIRGHASLAGVDVGGDNYEFSLCHVDGTVSLEAEAYSNATSVDRHNASCFTYAYLTNTEVIALRVRSEAGDDLDLLGAQLTVELIRP